MNLPCCLVQDLLPLHAEKLCSEETDALLRAHLAVCANCRAQLASLSAPQSAPEEDVSALKAVRAGIRKRRWIAALLAALIVFLPLFCLLARESAPRYLHYDASLVTVSGLQTAEDGAGEALHLLYDGRVTGVQTEMATDEETGETTAYLAAYTNKWDERTGLGQSGGELVLYPAPDRVIYGFGSRQTLLYGQPMNGGVQILPRLALGYYVLMAVGLSLVCGLLWLLLRKHKAGRVCKWLCIGFACYPIAHLLIKGMRTTSFDLPREFLFILIAAAALFGIAYLAFAILRQRRLDRQ